MFPAAIVRSKRDHTSVLGISERHARLDDAFEPDAGRIVFGTPLQLRWRRGRRETPMSRYASRDQH